MKPPMASNTCRMSAPASTLCNIKKTCGLRRMKKLCSIAVCPLICPQAGQSLPLNNVSKCVEVHDTSTVPYTKAKTKVSTYGMLIRFTELLYTWTDVHLWGGRQSYISLIQLVISNCAHLSGHVVDDYTSEQIHHLRRGLRVIP